jgi:hypothetical protein
MSGNETKDIQLYQETDMTPPPAILPIARPPADKVVRIQGRPWLIVVWDEVQWRRLQDSERPDDAFQVGSVWMVMRPMVG